MQEIKAIIRPERLDEVLHALHELELPGVTVSEVRGIGRVADATDGERQYATTPMAKIEIVVPEALGAVVTARIAAAAGTGRPGDGKIFAYHVTGALRIRTRERDDAAL